MAEYIEREALLAEIDEEIEYRTPMYTDEQNDYLEKGLRIARKDIKHFPAADVVEVRHGEWVYCPETITLRSHFYCSACNGARYEHYAKNNFRYCPNCGAKMDGKGDIDV